MWLFSIISDSLYNDLLIEISPSYVPQIFPWDLVNESAKAPINNYPHDPTVIRFDSKHGVILKPRLIPSACDRHTYRRTDRQTSRRCLCCAVAYLNATKIRKMPALTDHHKNNWRRPSPHCTVLPLGGFNPTATACLFRKFHDDTCNCFTALLLRSKHA